LEHPPVVTVDHGTPIRPVAEVRNFIGAQLRRLLGDQVSAFAVASMERRDGPEYDFNEPLLVRVLRRPPFCDGQTIVSMMFLNPGRHAGPGGDVATICEEARNFAPNLRPYMTELVAEHPLLLSILKDRYKQALQTAPLGT
ncbi:MAG: cobalamin biosynthesis protein CbiX, partial [Opitutales bacterium]